ncbi:hypothetical protein D7Y27_10145 [Corallococcus sp. AB004]|uniref:hypothetical protein n=1 Tax=Corallococcus TaxID=83461 RepID=UPI000EA11F98|nr:MULTISPECIES: hypothetical protein [Corallococcus]RKI45585.1 hypothetical protein D7Y27_10145 [Corallococcus sp. AB004]NPC69726.1 hypothetical protein [Corallococcus exiguus]NPD24197.1 hypothetical protein [Corallococcus exiguus]NRD44315.1 hypothetical protein [Corallococcus exiguus]RKH96567.1 hypothetical protein D7Y04_29505 [Corallococcus sp. AB038B]
MDSRGRRRVWLVGALLLFAGGAVLMFTGQGDKPAAEAPDVEFPRRMRGTDLERAEKRRTWVMPAVVDAGVAAPAKPRDPLLAALPRGPGRTAVVIEANALRYSPVGELLMDCLLRDGGKNLEQFKALSGVDPLQDLDRLVVTDEGVILSGDFSKAKYQELLGERVASDHGPGARVYEPGDTTFALPDGGTQRGRMDSAVGTWNNQMLVFGKSPDSVKTVLDRMDGRGQEEGAPLLDENSTYGEMYGVLAVETLAKLLGPGQEDLARRLTDVAQNVELHLDTSGDVAMVANVTGLDAEKMTDLGKSLGGALSMARMKAQADGKDDLAQLLDFAKIRPDGSSFKLELAVPLATLQEQLAWCRQERQASERAKPAP